MKICLCIDKLNSGGAERVLSTLANEFCNMGNDVILIETSTSKWDFFYNVDSRINHIFLLDHANKHKGIFKKIAALRDCFKTEKPDAIVSFKYQSNINVHFANLFLKIPHIVSERNDPYRYNINFLSKILKKRIFRRSNGAVFQTNDAIAYYFKRKGRCLTSLIPNPVFITYKPGNSSIVRNQTILYVGRLDEQKNPYLLIDSFEKIFDDFSGYILKMYGTGVLETSLKHYIYNLKSKNNIIFAGTSKTWHKDEFNDAVFVMPSNYEGMPNSLMEAMALGIPSIATDCPIGGPKQLIKNGCNGVLVPVNDVDAMSSALKDILSNPSKQNLISRNNHNMISDYSANRIANQWLKFIEEVVNN